MHRNGKLPLSICSPNWKGIHLLIKYIIFIAKLLFHHSFSLNFWMLDSAVIPQAQFHIYWCHLWTDSASPALPVKKKWVRNVKWTYPTVGFIFICISNCSSAKKWEKTWLMLHMQIYLDLWRPLISSRALKSNNWCGVAISAFLITNHKVD